MNNLVTLRENLGLTVKELSIQTNIHASKLLELENGTSKDYTLLGCLAKFYNVNLGTLMIGSIDIDAIHKKVDEINDRYKVIVGLPEYFKTYLFDTKIACSEIASKRAVKKDSYKKLSEQIEYLINGFTKEYSNDKISINNFAENLEQLLLDRFSIEEEETFYLGIQTGYHLYNMLNRNFTYNRAEEAYCESKEWL